MKRALALLPSPAFLDSERDPTGAQGTGAIEVATDIVGLKMESPDRAGSASP